MLAKVRDIVVTIAAGVLLILGVYLSYQNWIASVYATARVAIQQAQAQAKQAEADKVAAEKRLDDALKGVKK